MPRTHGKNLHPSAAIVGQSRAARDQRRFVLVAAATEYAVLLTGETGTGKSLLAQIVHRLSDRSRRPFVWLNCATLSPELLGSELFGHVRGAFTGANEDRTGAFQVASTGTLFLDEVAELGAREQAALLLAIETQSVRRVGSAIREFAGPRVIAATSLDLDKPVRGSALIPELRYRLQVLHCNVEPLRTRRGDILELTQSFLMTEVHNHKVTSCSSGVKEVLLRYDWPGNIRELRGVIQSALAYAGPQTQRIEIEHLPARLQSCARKEPLGLSLRGGLAKPQRSEELWQRVARALQHTGGNKQAAARLLGIHRVTLYRYLKRYSTDGAAPSSSEPPGNRDGSV